MSATQWEYTYVSVNTLSLPLLIDNLNRLGAEQWEVVGFASADNTIGFNAITAILKRPVVPPPPPTEDAAAWQDDPTGRFDKRHWNGRQWSAHVANASDKKIAFDPPTILDPPADG